MTTSPSRRSAGPRHLLLAAVTAIAIVVTLSACSSSKPDGKALPVDTTTSSSTTTSTAGSGSTLASIPSDTATVDVGNTDLGQVLVDLTGHTLYVFTADTTATPTCVDASCTAVWPPLTGTGIAVGTGVPTTSGEFKLVPRPDGTSQVTVNGQPLYTYSGDASPGATKGQGVGGQWFVVGLDGQPIKS